LKSDEWEGGEDVYGMRMNKCIFIYMSYERERERERERENDIPALLVSVQFALFDA
jgi:hypothetical protein